MSLKEQIKLDILKKIDDRSYTVGDMIPSERKLAESYNVNRLTVRRALDDLIVEGVVSKRPGIGTFINEKTNGHPLAKLMGLAEEIEAMGEVVDITLLDAEYVIPPEDARKKLGIETDVKVFLIKRQINTKGSPLLVSSNYFHPEIGPKLINLNLKRSIIFQALEDFGYPLNYAMQYIKACNTTEEEKKLLQIDNTIPTLEMSRTVYSTKNTPLIYSKSIINSNKYSYVVKLERQY
jgi:GntR family transcriptional regulator